MPTCSLQTAINDLEFNFSYSNLNNKQVSNHLHGEDYDSIERRRWKKKMAKKLIFAETKSDSLIRGYKELKKKQATK